MRIKSLAARLAVLAGVSARLAGCQETSTPAWRLDLHDITLTRIDEEGMTAVLLLTLTANRDATLRGVAFDQVTVNGVPIRVPPLQGPINLKRGQVMEGLSVEGRMKFRELTSLDPLRDMVRTRSADVHATVRAELDLNILQKLALLAGNVWVVADVSRDVPVNMPGGPLGQAAAFAMLTAADPIWIFGQAGQEWRRNQSEFAQEAAEGMAGSLVAIETTYELRSRDGEVSTARNWSTGLLMGDGRILTVAEALEPWRFNAALAEAIGTGAATVVPDRTEISASLLPARPDDAVPTLSLRKGELKTVEIAGRTETAISPNTQRSYSLRLRTADDNAAVLSGGAWKQMLQRPKPAAAASVAGWRPAAVYRIRFDNGGPTAVLWLTEAREENGRYRLKDPLDFTAIGSPVWIGDGVAGILQTQDTAAELGAVLNRLQHSSLTVTER
jgi:hypothetical protein